MKIPLMLLLVLVAAAALSVLNAPPPAGAAGSAAAPAGPAAAAGKPLVAIGGSDSRMTEKSFHRVTSEAQWAKVWESHRGKDQGRLARPQVDFGRCTLIAAFAGEAQALGLEVDSVHETADAVVIRCNFQGYSTGFGAKPTRDTPYGFVVLPKTDKTIVLEHDVAGHKAVTPTPPEWKEMARLPANAR